MVRRLVVYGSPWCYNCKDVREALAAWNVPYVDIDITHDGDAAHRVRTWTGFESVPTLVIADQDSVEPYTLPEPLAHRASPRGIDRGSMLTEPNRNQLRAWLSTHGLLEVEC